MENQNNTQPVTPVEVVDIQFRQGQKVYYFDPAGLSCKAGDHVIIDTARGAEYGICAAGNHHVHPAEVVAPLRKVLRHATAQDERIAAENQEKEKRAFSLCLDKIREHQLDMQLVSAECAFDNSKILFFFTADERVDFRELVKDLASALHCRIELRQIGVRDKAKMVGGLGICGRPFCCASFLDDFQPVSIKMAKTQNLSLNPTKISGTCGRLMCCLKYEQEAYEDLIRTSPKAESFVDTPEGRGTVVDIDLLRQRVKVRMEDAPESIQTFANTDIAVLRNGKAKKNDPPIPADLAPISGNGKRVRKDTEEDTGRMFLDPIKFRYSTDSVVDETAADDGQTEAIQEETAETAKRSRRRNRRGKGEKSAQEAEAPKNAEPPEAPKQPKEQKTNKSHNKPKKASTPPAENQQKKEEGEAKAADPQKKRRRNNHHRRKPKANGDAPSNE